MSGRIRSIKPEWLEDEALLSCSSDARVASIALLLLADDHGNGRGSDKYLGAQIFPGEPLAKIRVALASLTRIRYVGFYEVDGQRYYAVRNWKKHQRVDRPGKPRVPVPLDDFRDTLAKIRVTLATDPDPDPDPDLDQDQDQDHDHISAAPKKIAAAAEREIATSSEAKPGKPKTPSAPVAEAPGYADAVECWFVNYQAVYKQKPVWNGVQGRQMKNIIAKVREGELLELIPQFFHGPYPDTIRDGHSLSDGYSCLAKRLDMLRADLANPERRAKAATFAFKLRNAEKGAATDDAVAGAIRIIKARGGSGGN